MLTIEHISSLLASRVDHLSFFFTVRPSVDINLFLFYIGLLTFEQICAGSVRWLQTRETTDGSTLNLEGKRKYRRK